MCEHSLYFKCVQHKRHVIIAGSAIAASAQSPRVGNQLKFCTRVSLPLVGAGVDAGEGLFPDDPTEIGDVPGAAGDEPAAESVSAG